MVCSKKERGVISIYFPQLIWDLSVILVAIFSLLNFIEILDLQFLSPLLKGRLAIQLLFVLSFALKLLHRLIVAKEVDKTLIISICVAVYLFSIGLINYDGQTNLTTLLSTSVWTPLFIGYLISSFIDKKIDFTFSTVLFGTLSTIFLGCYFYLHISGGFTNAMKINSFYYFTISLLFLAKIKNKIIFLILLLVSIVLSAYFGKTTYVVAALFALMIYFICLIENISQKAYSIILDVFIGLILLVAVGLITVIVLKVDFLDTVSKITNGRSDLIKSVVESFLKSDFIHMFFGHGYDSVALKIGLSAHSDYLEVLYDYGIFGFIGFISFLAFLYYKISKIRDYRTEAMCKSIFWFIAAFMLASHVLFILKYSLMVFLLFGVLVSDTTTRKQKEEKSRKKVAWILPAKLPLPSVRGGAIETLLQSVIDINEKTNDFEFVVISKYNKEAYKKSKEYKNTVFYYQRVTIFTKLYDFIYHFLYKATKTFIPRHFSIVNFYKRIRIIEAPDVCVFDGDYSQFTSLEGDEKFVAYLHVLPLMLKKQRGVSLISKLDETWVISDFVKNKMCEYVKGDSQNKIAVIMNCINLNEFKRDDSCRDAIREKYGFKKSDFVVAYCGRIVEGKGIKHLVLAFNGLPEKYKLLILGSANFAGAKQDRFGKNLYKLSTYIPAVKFAGYINHDELNKYYSSVDLLCSPSKCEEAACLVNIEAAACGLPVLTSRDGGIPQYMGDACVYLDYNNRVDSIREIILLLSKSKKTLEELSEKGLKQSRKYSVKTYYNSIKNRIDKLFVDEETKL